MTDPITEYQRRERILNEFGNFLLVNGFLKIEKINSSNKVSEVVTKFLQKTKI